VEQAALRLLACREHFRAELRRKLTCRTCNPALIEPVLDTLEARNALSDRRFVEGYIESRVGRGFGPLRIRAELLEKGLDSDLVSRCLDAQDFHWEALLRETAARKFGPGPAAGRHEQAVRARFLEYRGYYPAHIRRYLWPHE
jgi:regulatory protein